MIAQTWPMVKLGDVVELLDNKRRPITKKDRKTGIFPYYGATGILDYIDNYIFDEPLVLLGEDGAKWGKSENSAYAISGKTWVNNHAHVLKPKRDILDDRFLILYLNDMDLNPFISGSVIPKLNQINTRNIPIHLPPLTEQKRIAAILDKAYDLCQLRRHALKKLDVLGAAIFHDMFIRNNKTKNYKTIEINKITKKINKISSKINFNCSEFVYIDISSISRSEKRIDNPLNIKVEKAPSRAKQIISTGDILISTVRPNLNAVAKVEQKYNNAIASTGFCVLRPYPEKLNETYLYYWVKYPTFVNDMIKQATGQSYPAVSDKIVRKSLIPLPPLAEQERFAARIAKLEALQEHHRQALAKQEMLFQSLQQRAFRGEL